MTEIIRFDDSPRQTKLLAHGLRTGSTWITTFLPTCTSMRRTQYVDRLWSSSAASPALQRISDHLDGLTNVKFGTGIGHHRRLLCPYNKDMPNCSCLIHGGRLGAALMAGKSAPAAESYLAGCAALHGFPRDATGWAARDRCSRSRRCRQHWLPCVPTTAAAAGATGRARWQPRRTAGSSNHETHHEVRSFHKKSSATIVSGSSHCRLTPRASPRAAHLTRGFMIVISRLQPRAQTQDAHVVRRGDQSFVCQRPRLTDRMAAFQGREKASGDPCARCQGAGCQLARSLLSMQ